MPSKNDDPIVLPRLRENRYEDADEPAQASANHPIALRPFLPVDEKSTDSETTTSDLNILNNHLEMCDLALPSVKTVAGLCMLSATVAKLIEVRRKVKKLDYGARNGSVGRTFEVLE